MRKITKLEDLAAAVGCSIATVSRALSNKGVVRESTRAKIMHLARIHDFPVYKYGLDVRGSKHGIIVAVIPKLPARPARQTDPFMQELLGQIGEAAAEKQFDLQISYSSPSNRDELYTFLDRIHADGLIFLGQGLLHDYLNEVADHREDFIVWGAKLSDQRYRTVGSDNWEGGWKAARHLLQIGRQNIVFFGDVIGPEMRQRYEGFCAALDFDAKRGDGFFQCDLDMASATNAVQHLLNSGRSVDAIVAVNDVVAAGLINGLTILGRKIPADVAIVGYDDVEFCKYLTPSLSSISQGIARAGRVITSSLLENSHLQGKAHTFATDLIVRASSGF